jgi:hypothetical protein
MAFIADDMQVLGHLYGKGLNGPMLRFCAEWRGERRCA